MKKLVTRIVELAHYADRCGYYKIAEDLDVGHQDDEPNMLKADLFRIAKYAKELYEMLNQFDNSDKEIDFPHWWQSDIVRAKELMVNAKHYLNGELNVNGNPLGESKKRISEGLEWHLKNKKPLSENVFRYGSPKFFKLVANSGELSISPSNF